MTVEAVPFVAVLMLLMYGIGYAQGRLRARQWARERYDDWRDFGYRMAMEDHAAGWFIPPGTPEWRAGRSIDARTGKFSESMTPPHPGRADDGMASPQEEDRDG